MITVNDLFKATSRGAVSDVQSFWKRYPPKRSAESLALVKRVYALCQEAKLDFALAIARIADETGDLNGPAFMVSDIWNARLNPGGIGVTDSHDEMIGFENGKDAADAYMAHLFTYVLGADYNILGVTRKKDPRYQPVADAGWVGTVKTLNDLKGKWFTSKLGAVNSAIRGNAIFDDLRPSKPPADDDDDDVKVVKTRYSTSIPGLPGGPLGTDYPIHLLIVPPSQSNNRPGYTARTPRKGLQHGNGNPNSTAAGEARYLFNGAEGRQASYHSTADDIEVWIMIPANEVTWQAADGDGPGNMNGFSCEMVEDADIWGNYDRRDREISYTADFMGRVAARLNIDKPEQHWDYNYNNAPSQRHDCPNRLRHTSIGGRLAWDIYVDRWKVARADEKARMTGGVSPTTPPAKPVYPTKRTAIKKAGKVTFKTLPIVTVQLNQSSDRWACIQGTSARTYPDRDAPAAVKTPFKAGKTYTFDYRTTVDDEIWLVSSAGTYALRKAFSQAAPTKEHEGGKRP